MTRRTIRAAASILAISGAMLIAPSRPASACPNCKEAVALQAPEEAQRLASGYFYSILLMIAMPSTLLAIGGFAVTRAVKKGLLPEM